MRRVAALGTAILCLLTFGARSAKAQVEYLLEGASAFTEGCFDPCDCPVTMRPMFGRFVLTFVAPGPFYNTYAVTEIDWTVIEGLEGEPALHLTGSGEYRINAGHGPPPHQLLLSLVIDGGPVQQFDSGIQTASTPYPRIDIDSAANGFACFDTVIEIRARPRTPTGADIVTPSTALVAAGPSPFRNDTRVDFALARSGRIDLTVYDVAGRIVRRLAHGVSLPAGPHSVAWNGALEHGAAAPAGVYMIVLESGGVAQSRRVVKLQ